jgi:inhibitor of Bruton tyrosine kinase
VSRKSLFISSLADADTVPTYYVFDSGPSNAWTAVKAKPSADPSPGAITSFAAIQLMQQEEDVLHFGTKQSLKEIQEEERAQKAEQDFLKWWANEEERLRLEREATLNLSGGKKGSKRAKNAGQGRGPRERDTKNVRPKMTSSSQVKG